MKNVLFLIIFLLTLINAELCVDVELDLYEGFNSSMGRGSMFLYDDNVLLLAGRNEDGTHLFSYTPGDASAKVLQTFTVSSQHMFLSPFEFGETGEVAYQVYDDNLKGVALFYLSGDIHGDVEPVQLKVRDGEFISQFVKFAGRYFARSHEAVYLINVTSGDFEVLSIEGCESPRDLSVNVKKLVVTCTNNTRGSFSNTTFFTLNVTSFMFEQYHTGAHIPYYSKSPFFNSGNFSYIIASNGIWKTDFESEELIRGNGSIATWILGAGDTRLFGQKSHSEGQVSSFEYYTEDNTFIVEVTIPFEEIVILNQKLYFLSDCEENNINAVVCVFDPTLGTVDFLDTDVQINQIVSANGELYFVGSNELYGSELYILEGDEVVLVADIFRGARGGMPNTFTEVDGKLYFLARDIRVGREIFTINSRPDCGLGNVVYCDRDENICDGDDDEDVVYIGDINIIDINLNTNTTIEGSLYGSGNLNFNSNIDILGEVVLKQGGTISINPNKQLKIQGCLTLSNGSLVIQVDPEDLKIGSQEVQVFNDICIRGSFKEIQIEGTNCSKVQVSDVNYENGMAVSFIVTDICGEDSFPFILVVIAGATVLVLAVIVALVLTTVPCVKHVVFPNRDRAAKAKRTKNSRISGSTSSISKSKGTTPA